MPLGKGSRVLQVSHFVLTFATRGMKAPLISTTTTYAVFMLSISLLMHLLRPMLLVLRYPQQQRCAHAHLPIHACGNANKAGRASHLTSSSNKSLFAAFINLPAFFFFVLYDEVDLSPFYFSTKE